MFYMDTPSSRFRVEKTARQKAYVKETLTRAFDEVKAARRGETKMMTEEEFLEGLKAVHVC